jgi:hypothetical protein
MKKIVDSKGRLFGKVSILDVGAACVILLVLVGIFLFPGTTGSIAQVNATKPIEVDVIVRGLSVLDPELVIQEFNKTKKANIIIRNQPYGQVDIINAKQLPRNLVVPQPDGSPKVFPDPRTDSYSVDLLMTLGGKAQITKDGPVLGNNKIKIGVPIELEGFNYDFNATVIALRIQDK